MSNILKLAQILSSKLCHELSGLVGSISTSAELTNSSDSSIKDRANQILKTTPGKLHNLINFYRTVYGFADNSDLISLQEIEILCSYVIPKRIKFALTFYNLIEININLGRLIMCLVVLASKNILKEGSITVNITDCSNRITMNVYGDYLKENTKEVFVDHSKMDDTNLDVYNVHDYYTSYLCNSLNFVVSVSKLQGQIQYSACLSQ
ncbi:MAG: hypothetical protein EOP33_04550 [Rickettsiaceae bacterium]|nr:MAG: hypothetical protein EOP33_04550 [Rickettsiaceae bacterium]